MYRANLEQVIEEAKELTPEELRLLREVVESLLATVTVRQPIISEEEFELELAAEGFICEAKAPLKDFSAYRNYRPIEVKGQPVSEMIIEERG